MATRTFLRTVDAGSFSAAARDMGLGQPTVSKQIAALEKHLGVQLVTRSTRSLSLTEEGRRFYEHSAAAVDAFGAAEAAARGDAAVEGRLRIGCPVAFGQLHVVPHLPAFLAQHPAVSVELEMSDAVLDPVAQGVDMDIRIGALSDSALKARRIAAARRITVAAPSYLAKHGTPETPEDLDAHECVIFTRLQTGDAWPYLHDGAPVLVPVRGRIRADNSSAVREAVLMGMGIGLLPYWLVGQAVRDGRLVRLLGPFDPAPFPINVITPPRRFVPPRVTAFTAHLRQVYRDDPCLN